jgi:hypothetical protein
MEEVGGASLVAWALAGGHLKGTAGFKDINGNDPAPAALKGLAPWADDVRTFHMTGSLSRSTFVDVSKMKFPKGEVTTKTAVFRLPTAVNADDTLETICFLDAFDQPILYYRANPGRAFMAADQSPMDEVTAPAEAGVYNVRDNYNITHAAKSNPSMGIDLGGGPKHFFPEQPSRTNGNKWRGQRVLGTKPNVGSFSHTVWNPQASSEWAPHNPETYILLSAGPDAVFGTLDDIANFPMAK